MALSKDCLGKKHEDLQKPGQHRVWRLVFDHCCYVSQFIWLIKIYADGVLGETEKDRAYFKCLEKHVHILK